MVIGCLFDSVDTGFACKNSVETLDNSFLPIRHLFWLQEFEIMVSLRIHALWHLDPEFMHGLG